MLGSYVICNVGTCTSECLCDRIVQCLVMPVMSYQMLADRNILHNAVHLYLYFTQVSYTSRT